MKQERVINSSAFRHRLENSGKTNLQVLELLRQLWLYKSVDVINFILTVDTTFNDAIWHGLDQRRHSFAGNERSLHVVIQTQFKVVQFLELSQISSNKLVNEFIVTVVIIVKFHIKNHYQSLQIFFRVDCF
jgi:hypothetical protein